MVPVRLAVLLCLIAVCTGCVNTEYIVGSYHRTDNSSMLAEFRDNGELILTNANIRFTAYDETYTVPSSYILGASWKVEGMDIRVSAETKSPHGISLTVADMVKSGKKPGVIEFFGFQWEKV